MAQILYLNLSLICSLLHFFNVFAEQHPEKVAQILPEFEIGWLED